MCDGNRVNIIGSLNYRAGITIHSIYKKSIKVVTLNLITSFRNVLG